MCDCLNHKVFEEQIFVILVCRINSVNDSGNQILHTFHGRESCSKVFVLNCYRILYPVIHGMESSFNVRKSSFQFSTLCLFSTEFPCFCNAYEYFLYGFTKFQITFFQLYIIIIERSTFNSNRSNSVYKSAKELVCKCRISIKHFSNLWNIGFFRNFRYKILILHRCVLSDGIKNIHCRRIKCSYTNSSRHFYYLTFLL